MKLKISPEAPITLFVRVKGPKGARELQATLDIGSNYSVISTKDAIQLGYDVAWFDPTNPDELQEFGRRAVTFVGIIETREMVIEEISVAELVAKDVKALLYDLPLSGGIDMVLGVSFLKNFKTTINFKQGILTIENV